MPSRSSPAPSRQRHVVDLALEYAALAADGMRAAEIARRRRRSKAHVSILLRLGQALTGFSAEEVAALRTERITWKLAQRLVRADVPPELLRQRLRLALGGFSSYTVDRRRLRRGRRAATDSPPYSPDAFVWHWDAAWAARDPVGYVEAYRGFLARMHRGVSTRLRTAASPAPVGAPALAGQSLRRLTQTLTPPRAAVGDGPPGARQAARQALVLLAELDGPLFGLGQRSPETDEQA